MSQQVTFGQDNSNRDRDGYHDTTEDNTNYTPSSHDDWPSEICVDDASVSGKGHGNSKVSN